MRKHVRIAVLLTTMGVFGCRCEEAGPTEIAPQIYLDACASPQKEVNGIPIGGYEDCLVDFGERDISVKVTRSIKVTNPSIVELTFFNIEIIGSPAFQVELKPDTIGPGLSGDIVISVRPNTETTLEGTLFVKSDANNTNQTPDNNSLVEIPLRVVGVDNGLPDISIEPLACDYARVPVGGVQTCNVSIANQGSRALVLDSAEFIAVGSDPAVLFQVPPESTAVPFAFTGRPPGPDEEIGPGTSVTIPVRFTPDVLGNYQGMLRFRSNDPDEEQIDVPLSGIAVTPPTCVIRIQSVNGVEVTGNAPPAIEPLDNVILTLEDSTPSSVGGSIVRQQWNIGRRPPGSGVQLTDELGETTGFTFDNGDDLGVDVAGEYTVRAIVYDDLETPSVNECELTFEAIPKDNFLVQLTWDTDTNDMDLHVTRQSAADEFCIDGPTNGPVDGGNFAQECDSGLDCNYATCDSNSGRPDWDGQTGITNGDPSLDIDDMNGYGPENINVDVMAPGLYLVGVNGFSTSSSNPVSGCTVRIFVFGRLAAEFYVEAQEEDWFEVALVEWPADPSQPVCVEDLLDGNLTDDFDACHAP